MSKRTQIRTAFAALITGLATTGANVFVARTRPLADANLPAILVFSGEHEPVSNPASSMRPDAYTFRLRADIVVKDSSTAEATADSILEEIETAVFASIAANTLSGLVAHTRLVSVGEPDLDDALEKPAVRVPVLFEVFYTE